MAPKRRGIWKKTEQPEWWAREVQSDLRAQRPPLQPPQFMIVGEDAEGIAAAGMYVELEGPGVVEVQSVAVATRYRGLGGALADDLLNEIFARIDERAVASGIASVLVTGRIYGLNVPSQRMALRARMRHVDTLDNGVQEWIFNLTTSLIEETAEPPPRLF